MTTTLEQHQAADDRARENISTLLHRSLFVEAGAGTGKTKALVDRFVALVSAGRKVEELVAITFTEKAAAELRDRVRAEIELRLREGTGGKDLLEQARDSLDRSQVSTIHAFCAGVLRAFAAESGIDPSFKVEDQVAAERRFEERWLAYLEERSGDDKAHEAFSRLLELGLYPGDLERLAKEMWENPALAERLAAKPIPSRAAAWPDLGALRRRLAELRPEQAINGDEMAAYIATLDSALVELINSPTEERPARLAGAILVVKEKLGATGRVGNWPSIPLRQVREEVKEVGEELQKILAAIRSEALGTFLPYVVGFANDDAKERRRSGELVFEDLILQVRNILRDYPHARRRLRARYHTLLIDEFQDTDPAQTDIALAFAIDPDTGSFEDGRLFLVGDPKQSIYRFRRADMVIYSATRRRLAQNNGVEEELALNRRSRETVLDFVNNVFKDLIGDGPEPKVQPAYKPIHPYRGDVLRGPGVGLIGGVMGGTAREMRIKETQQVAAYCRRALDDGWQVAEKRTGLPRPAEYRDIAILLPTRTSLAPLERALGEAGVPYRVEGGSLVYSTQEVRDLLNCLSAIDDPTNEVAVAGSLRSPAYGFSDVGLARHKVALGGGFDYMDDWRLGNKGDATVNDALRDLRDFHELRGLVPIAALTERFIASHRLVEAGLFTSGSRDPFRRARFVIEQGRQFESEQPESLRAFVDWLSRRANDAILDYEGAGLDDDEDAVRILTIHAAKGLEFPIVFLAGLGVSPSNQDDTYMIDRITDEVAVSIGSGPSSRNNKCTLGDYDNVRTQERAHIEAERVRLLYVAATRARDHLVVSLYYKGSKTHAELLEPVAVETSAERLPELPPVTGAATGPFAGLQVDAVAMPEEAFVEQRRTVVASARGQRVSSATALGKAQAEEDDEKEREDETEPWARGRAGTNRGRAVHAALQVLPWDADAATVQALAQAQAVAESIPDQAVRVALLLQGALETGAAERARSARRALREVPFAFMEAGMLLEGFIDLVLEGEDDSLEVVDWKTDSLQASEVATRLESYKLQAGLYVLGLEAATGRTVSRVTYVFVTPGQEASPGEPRDLAEEARRRIADAAAG